MTGVTTFPWPRKCEERGKPIKDPALRTKDPIGIFKSPSFSNRKFNEAWDAYDTLVYNAWLGVRVLPTKLLDIDFLTKLGTLEPVLELVKNIGLGKLGVAKHVLYADLVRQFMATLRIHYRKGRINDPKYGELHFKLNGKVFILTMSEFGGIYGLDCSGTACHFPKSPREAGILFELIGNKGFSNNKTKQLEVRHPVLRYVLKFMANTFFLKQESSKLRVQELILLAKGLSEDVFPRNDVEVIEKPHLGAVFAHNLLSMQGFPFDNQDGMIRFGTLLTPLFEQCKATNDAIKIDKRMAYLDRMHFIHGGNLTNQWEWIFLEGGKENCIQLPNPEYTGISTAASLLFHPPADSFKGHSPSRKRVNPSAAKTSPEDRSSTSQNTLEDGNESPDFRNQEEVNRWLVHNQKRQHVLLEEIFRRLPAAEEC